MSTRIDHKLIENALDKFERRKICGEITVDLPKPPPFRSIDNYDKKKVDQKFRYLEMPDNVDDIMDLLGDDFIEREYNRIRDGYWFFNFGNLEYITGYHYAFLNYMYIDG